MLRLCISNKKTELSVAEWLRGNPGPSRILTDSANEKGVLGYIVKRIVCKKIDGVLITGYEFLRLTNSIIVPASPLFPFAVILFSGEKKEVIWVSADCKMQLLFVL